MATEPFAAAATEVVMVPPRLVALVGAQRMRLLHAEMLRELERLEHGGFVAGVIEARPGGHAVNAAVETRRKL